MCKRHEEAFQSTNLAVIILRCRTHTRLSRKSGYFKRWLEYSNEFGALKASGKLKIVLLSWERTRWATLIQSCNENVLWTLFKLDTELRYGKLIEPKTPWTPQTMPVYCFKESLISWTNWIKRKLNSMQQGTVRMFKWTFDLTTRNTLQ